MLRVAFLIDFETVFHYFMLKLALGRVFYAKKHLVAWVARTSLVPVWRFTLRRAPTGGVSFEIRAVLEKNITFILPKMINYFNIRANLRQRH